jgi:hypothetical protein
MLKLDFKKDFKELYSPPSKEAVLLEVPPLNYLMIDGTGNPNTSPQYQEAIEALYTLSYTLKFMLKKSGELDYSVSPLEGLWWSDNMDDFIQANKDNWKWTMMIRQPEQITPALLAEAVAQAEKKKDLPNLRQVRLESFEEGLVAQIMYFGPYAEEGPTIQRLHSFIRENGYSLAGKHHEIYLSDPRRTAPEKLRTIIRQPAR